MKIEGKIVNLIINVFIEGIATKRVVSTFHKALVMST